MDTDLVGTHEHVELSLSNYIDPKYRVANYSCCKDDAT